MTSITPSAQYRLNMRVELDDSAGLLGRVTSAIGEAGGIVAAVDPVEIEHGHSLRDIVVDAGGPEHWDADRRGDRRDRGRQVIDRIDRTFQLHIGGKIEQHNKHPLKTRDDLSMAYTPGVARVCLAIADDDDKAFQYTIKRNTVAVVSDGTAVLGLGDIGPRAAMPVMEGKCCLFKEFAGVDAFPICLDTKDTEEIVETVKRIAPAFGGINLEDISAPRCFEIEERLEGELDIPIFHDDQHGTAVVVMAALLNAVKLTGSAIEESEGADHRSGRRRDRGHEDPARGRRRTIIGADSRGALHVAARGLPGRTMNPQKRWFARGRPTPSAGTAARPSDRWRRPGDRALRRTGPAGRGAGRMNDDAMVFAMANPNPEVIPEEAAPYVRIMATGRSDYPNQINNVLAFPGIFRGALDVRARSDHRSDEDGRGAGDRRDRDDDELREDYIIPSVFNRDVAPAVAAAVAEQARASGMAAAAGNEVGFAQGDTQTGMPSWSSVPAGDGAT